jgi:hypothetical protein
MRRTIILFLLLCPFYSAHAQDSIVGRENGRVVSDLGAQIMSARVAATGRLSLRFHRRYAGNLRAVDPCSY